jgi:hypothetical protein
MGCRGDPGRELSICSFWGENGRMIAISEGPASFSFEFIQGHRNPYVWMFSLARGQRAAGFSPGLRICLERVSKGCLPFQYADTPLSRPVPLRDRACRLSFDDLETDVDPSFLGRTAL